MDADKPDGSPPATRRLIARVKAILTSPKTEWPRIAQEPATIKSLYTGYIMILAAMASVFGFLGTTFFNGNLALFGIERLSVSEGLAEAAIGYVLSLAVVFILSRVIDALAPSFGGQRDRVQALKTAAYTYTAGWVASVGMVIPVMGLPLLLVGELYGIYLLSLGLPHTMKIAPGRRGGYTAVIVMISVLLSWVIGLVTMGLTTDVKQQSDGQVQSQPKTDPKQTQQAAASPADATTTADSERMLTPERLQEFAPESLDNLQRESVSAQRTSAMGLKVSTVKATYRNDGRRDLRLEITDSGGARAVLSILGWTGPDEDQLTSTGYKRSYLEEGRRVHEQWDNSHNGGEYGVVVDERFIVRVQGRASSIEALKEAVRQIDLGGLAP